MIIRFSILCTLFFSLLQRADGQGQQSISLSEMFTQLVTDIRPDSMLIIENYTIVDSDNFSPYAFLTENYPDLPLEDGRFVIDQELILHTCTLPDVLNFDSLHFKKGIAITYSKQKNRDDSYIEFNNILSDKRMFMFDNNIGSLIVLNSDFKDYLAVDVNDIYSIYFKNNTFKNNLAIENNKHRGSIYLDANMFDVQNRLKLNIDRPVNNEIRSSTVLTIDVKNIQFINLENNSFRGSNENSLVRVAGNTRDIAIMNNEFFGILELNIKVEGSFKISSNRIAILDITETSFSETNNWISFGDTIPELVAISPLGHFNKWNQEWVWFTEERVTVDTSFDNSTVSYQKAFDIYYARKTEDLISEEYYKRTIKSYYHLQNVFRSNGDIENSNLWYAKMKETEAVWLRLKVNNGGSLNVTFRYLLNRLMNFYTVHGTDPARAVVISMWICTAFAFFYLFFPLNGIAKVRANWFKTSGYLL